ncbi:MAG: putative Ig domain-containing protein [Wenzhouxiangella sp.]
MTPVIPTAGSAWRLAIRRCSPAGMLILLALAFPVLAEPLEFGLNEEVSGTVGPGEERIYRLRNVPLGQRVYLQRTAGTNPGQLAWSIEDDFGRLIDANATAINDLGPVALMGGDYTLTIRGRQPTSSGSFSFILHAVSDSSSSLLPGQLDQRSLGSVGATHRYDLTLAQPGPVHLLFGIANANQLSYRLTDGLGNLREDWTASGPVATEAHHLPAGTHQIEVRGRNAFSGEFSLRVRPALDSAPITLPLNGSAAYESADVTETTRLAFTLTETTRVYPGFSFSHASSAAQWRLERADGLVLVDWTVNMNPIGEPLNLIPGDYVLSVRSRITTPVAGSVVLHEVIDGETVLQPDQPTTAAIAIPGQTQRLQLENLPAGIYLLDRLATSNNSGLSWRLEDAVGRPVLAQTSNLNSIEDIALIGGDYTLVLSGNNAGTGSVEFALVTGTEVEIPVAFGGGINDAISQPGEIRRYTFSASANRSLTIERIASSNTSGLNLRLEDAAGREIIPRTTNLPASITVDLMGGDYVLTVRGQAGATGSYNLALNDAGPSDFMPSGTPLALDSPASGSVAAGTPERWLLSLDETARVYFDLIQGATGLRWSLFDGAGQALFVNQAASVPGLGGRGPFVLRPGEYVVEFELPSGGPVSYGFTAVNAEVLQSAIALDIPVDNQPVVPGFRNEYFFNLPGAGQHYFELLQGNSNLRWRLEDGVGREVFGRSSANSAANSLGPFTLAAGTYRLVFDAQSGAAPDYRFQVHSVSDQLELITLDTEPRFLTDSLAMPGQRHVYDLTIAPGSGQLYLQVLSGASALRYSLIDPAGQKLVSGRRLLLPNTDDFGPLPVPPGDYQLIVDANNPSTPAYALTLRRAALVDGLPAELDQDETWPSPQPGERRRYSFSLSQPTTGLAFRSLAAAGNVFVTLTHEDSGWQPLSNLQLQNLNAIGRGPFMLPAGDYSLDVFARAAGGDPAWRLVEVLDPALQAIAINEVLIVEYPMPGATMRYRVEPESDGQVLIFDLMQPAVGNQWTLIDPVGTVVFGPANASNTGSHDQGPFALAGGVYTLIFNNPTLQSPQWFFRVNRALSTIEVPEGCAACSELDIVFAFDTSGSMQPVAQAMCDVAEDLVSALADDGIPVNPVYWGITNTTGGSCLSSDIATELGPEVPGSPPPWMTSLFDCADGSAGPTENWAPATAILAERYPWTEGAVRLVMPVADEGPYCGDPVNQFDIDATFYGREFALANDIVVSPLMPDFTPDPVRALAEVITVGTGGIATVVDFGVDLVPVARAIALAACGTQQAIVGPSISDVSPLPGSLLPSGRPLTLSGRVTPVNQLRPVLEVEVNGQPSSVLDSSGSFFATITLAPGPNMVTISAVEACGPSVLELELFGAGDETDPWSGFGELTDLLEPRFRGTTFDRSGERLLVKVAVANTGTRLNGPILMAVGLDLHPGVNLLNADGFTPSGEPYVILVPEGETLGAGAESSVRELAFANPGREAIDFEPRWLAPANQPPVFSSIPITRATVGREWRYPVRVEDGNGDAVTLSLLVAPSGMHLSQQTLSWTPSQAGSFDVIIRASDGRGGLARQSFTVQVVEPGFNAPPVFTSTPVSQAPIAASYAYQAAAFDPDGDVLNFALLSAPAGMSVDAATGLVTWAPAQAGQHSIILQVDDGQGGQATQNYTLFVGEPATTPPGPAFASTPITVAAVGTQYRYRYSLNVAAGPQPSVSLAAAPAGMSLDSATRTLSWVPSVADLGSSVVELLAVDAAGQEARQRFSISVLDTLPNQPPYFTSSPVLAAVVGQTWTYAAEAVDPEFEALQFSLAQAPAGMSVDAASGLLEWTPAPGAAGSAAVSLVVTDPHGAEAVQQFSIQVRAGNASPSLTNTPPATVFIGQTYSHLFLASDPDGDALRYILRQGPPGMTLDPEAGWLSWSTVGFAPGSYAFAVAVEDDWGGADVQSFTVQALADTEPPTVAIAMARTPACATEPVQVCLQASDNVGVASRSLSIAGQVQSLTANCVSWTPPAPGSIPAVGSATDTSGLSTTVTPLLPVADCNDEQRPVVTLISPLPDSAHSLPVPIIASIEDNTPEILSWTVSLRREEDGAAEVLASGSGEVIASEIAVFDPTRLAAGTYFIDILGNDGVQTGGVRFRLNAGEGFKPGRIAFTAVDLTWPLGALPLAIGRSYDSLDAAALGESSADFSPGWRLALSASVSDSAAEAPPGLTGFGALMAAEPFSRMTRVHVVKPNGERVGFTFDPQPRGFPAAFQFDVRFKPDAGVTDTLRAVDGPDVVWALGGGFADFIIPYNPSIYELETADGVIYRISETEGLQEIRDPLGGVVTVTPDGFQSSRGNAVQYQRDGQGRISAIVLLDEEQAEIGRLQYGYDASGNLVSFTDLAGGVSTIEYAEPAYPHHLTGLFDALGNPIARTVFDDEGRMIAHCPGSANPQTLEGCSLFAFDAAGGSETLFDGRGFRSELFYNAAGQIIFRRDEVQPEVWVEQSWTYDEGGHVIEYIDGDGGVTVTTRDEQGRRLSEIEPDGRSWTWTWGECRDEDQWLQRCDGLGNCILQEFNAACEITRRVDPLGGETVFEYDALGQLSGRIDPTGQRISMAFDARGLLSRVTDGLGGELVKTYDPLGQPLSETERTGIRRDWTYDSGARLESETWQGPGAGSSNISWSHNANNLLEALSWPEGDISLTYGPNGKVRRMTHTAASAPDWWVEYSYDVSNNITRLEDSFGGITEYDYDGLNRVTEIRQHGTGVVPKRVVIDNSHSGQPIQLRRYASLDDGQPGPITDFEYGCLSCPTTLSRIAHRRSDQSLIHDLVYQRNPIHQIIGRSDQDGAHSYVYDGRGWLIQATHPPGFPAGNQSFVWDGAGNWLSRSGNFGAATSATLSYQQGLGGHRLQSDGVHSYQYDANGALIERSGPTGRLELDRDGRGNVIAIREFNASGQLISSASYAYSSNQQRVKAERDGVVRHYVFDGPNPIIALDADGQVVWRQLHLRDPDRPLAMEVGGQLVWLLSDHIGSVREQVNNDGQVLASFSYDAFGRQLSGPAASLDDPVRYTGREFDLPGGLGYYRLRLYDPAIGRFLSEDSLEPWHYRYAENNPLSLVDPDGAAAVIEFLLQVCNAVAFAKSPTGQGEGDAAAFAFAGNVEALKRQVRANLKSPFLPCGFGGD